MRGNLRMPRVPEEASQVRWRPQLPGGTCWSCVHALAAVCGMVSVAMQYGQPCIHAHPPDDPPTRSCAAQEAADLMEQCTRLDPDERPSAQEVMKRLHTMLAAQRSGARREALL